MAALLEHCGTCMYRGTGENNTQKEMQEKMEFVSPGDVFFNYKKTLVFCMLCFSSHFSKLGAGCLQCCRICIFNTGESTECVSACV